MLNVKALSPLVDELPDIVVRGLFNWSRICDIFTNCTNRGRTLASRPISARFVEVYKSYKNEEWPSVLALMDWCSNTGGFDAFGA